MQGVSVCIAQASLCTPTLLYHKAGCCRISLGEAERLLLWDVPMHHQKAGVSRA
jgi:hypothetical protein